MFNGLRLQMVEGYRRAKFGQSQFSGTIAELWRFFDFSRWRPPPSLIFKFLKSQP